MAGSNKSGNNRKSNNGSKSGRNTKQRSNQARSGAAKKQRVNKEELERQKELRSEIILIIILAFSVFLLIANFGICGVVGNAVSGFFFGIIGFCEYVFPVYMFVSSAYLISNGFDGRIVKKVIYFGVVMVLLSMLFQAIYSPDFESAKVLYMDGYKSHAGGGIICGGIFFGIRKLLGVPGACIVMFIAAVIMFILITEISVVSVIRGMIDGLRENYDAETETYEDAETETYREAEIAAPERRHERKRVQRDFSETDASHRPRPSMANLDVYESPDRQETVVRPGVVREKRQKDFFANEDVHELSPAAAAIEPEPYDEPAEVVERAVMRDEDIAIPAAATDVHEGEDVLAGAVNGNIHPESISDYDPLEDSAFFDDKQRTEKKTQTTGKRTAKAAAGEKTYQEGRKYRLPTPDLLSRPPKGNNSNREAHVRETAIKLKNTLETFGVNVTITNYSCGPAVTRFEMQPEQGVKVSKILGLADDIKLNLAAADIRIEAPIPGKAAIGIEVPNKEQSMVAFRELIESDNFKNLKSKVAFAVGKDISGQVIATDIAKMPHLLIAGATGSGKSVCINTLIMSILYKATPEEVKLIMIDPKMVELACYNGIPHLLIPVVTDPKKAAGALNWAVVEMTRRYQLFAEHGVRNIQGYNDKVDSAVDAGADGEKLTKMPQIVVIVDELADLMMVAHGEVEDAIVRLSQLARAAGIHLVIATQRPSVDVITGLIKANVPSRIAFSVSSGVDSRTILDMVGAEKLLGKGDMLFYPTGYPKPVRVQGAFVSDDEVTAVVDFLKKSNGVGTYDSDIEKTISTGDSGVSGGAGGTGGNDRDDYFVEAGRFIIEKEKASIGMLQRTFKIGFNRAARIMDQLTAAGVVGPEMGTKARSILMTQEEFDDYIDNNL